MQLLVPIMGFKFYVVRPPMDYTCELDSGMLKFVCTDSGGGGSDQSRFKKGSRVQELYLDI